MSRAGIHPDREPGLAGLPAVSPFLLAWFARYTRWYLRRHFHAVRLGTEGWLPDTATGVPKVILLNHASWWDPLVCLHLWRHLFPGHRAYAPIDSRAVEKYAFFKRLGFFGVEPDSARGAATFLKTADRIAAQPWNTLWVTPQARFADVRERPVRFKHGVGHLAARVGRSEPGACGRLQFLPLAIEYTWWEERLPEVLLLFGPPIEVTRDSAPGRDPAEWTAEFEHRLEQALDTLAAAARRRDPSRFLNLLQGTSGIGGVYDLWRRVKSAARGQAFDPRHGHR